MKERLGLHQGRVDPAAGRDNAPSGSRSITQILQEIVNRISEIIRSEVRLVKTEIRQDIGDYVKAGSFLVLAGVLACFALGFILLGAVFAFETIVPPWLAAVLVGVLVGIVGTALFFIGRKRIRIASLRPDKTLQTLEDNVSWIKNRTR
jgi:uncharacterized membrane protein YqjE